MGGGQGGRTGWVGSPGVVGQGVGMGGGQGHGDSRGWAGGGV